MGQDDDADEDDEDDDVDDVDDDDDDDNVAILSFATLKNPMPNKPCE